ncbi:MAG: hypothetical protein L6R43_18975 [Planctomycetes bacterium]|nr:hypothetical protein [Planctomycetota bacterium]
MPDAAGVQDWIRSHPLETGAGALLVLVILVLLLRRGRKGRVAAPSREREALLGRLRAFRDEVKRGAEEASPVFRKVETEPDYAAVIGHWRKSLGHRFSVREPDFGALKTGARRLGVDAMPLSDLEVAWRKVARQMAEYDEGKMDASTTPIVTVRVFEKDLQKIVVLANIALQSLGK